MIFLSLLMSLASGMDSPKERLVVSLFKINHHTNNRASLAYDGRDNGSEKCLCLFEVVWSLGHVILLCMMQQGLSLTTVDFSNSTIQCVLA